jgi:hypothetical protein
MPVIMSQQVGSGPLRVCNSTCHGARHPRCECICAGRYHGIARASDPGVQKDLMPVNVEEAEQLVKEQNILAEHGLTPASTIINEGAKGASEQGGESMPGKKKAAKKEGPKMSYTSGKGCGPGKHDFKPAPSGKYLKCANCNATRKLPKEKKGE